MIIYYEKITEFSFPLDKTQAWSWRLIHCHLKQLLLLWPWEAQSHPSSDHWLRQLMVTPGTRRLASQGRLCWLTLPEGHLVGWWHQPLVWDLEKLVLYSQWGADTDSAIPKWRLALLIALHTLGNERRKSQNTVRLNISVTSSRRDSCSLAMVKSFRLLHNSCESDLHMKRLHMVCWSTEDAQ